MTTRAVPPLDASSPVRSPGASGEYELSLAAPIDRWDEAIPLGCGLLGVLVWGAGDELRLSLDRGDLWDRRPAAAFDSPQFTWHHMQEAVARGDFDFLRGQFEQPYRGSPHPTKLPAGRACLDLKPHARIERLTLDMRDALATVQLDRGTVTLFCDALHPVVMLRLRGVEAGLELVLPPYADHDAPDADGRHALQRLGYAAGDSGAENGLQWAHQPCADGFSYALVAATKRNGADETVIALTVATAEPSASDVSPIDAARERLYAALQRGFDTTLETHRQWWHAFWQRSDVRTGDEAIDRHYHLVRYFAGCASRRGAWPMPLQGLWTADEGRIPPWKGDYHHDLNTQLCYWPYLAMNDLEQGECFLDWLWALLPTAQRFARSFYGTEGACLPAVCSIDGQPMGGWHQYSFSPTCSAWLAHAFHRHWQYTQDPAFLAQRAWPFCLEVARCLHGLLVRDGNGMLKLPLSSSPEVHSNHPEAWFHETTNYDLALLRWLFGALVEMGGELGEDEEASRWQDALDQLPALAVGEAVPPGAPAPVLHVAPGEALGESHRHPSHMMAIHPLELLDMEDDEPTRTLILNTIRQLDFLGMAGWTGFTFTWLACMAARAGLAERAGAMLALYLKVTVSRNGFHLNGDYQQLGVLAAQYRPFTLEGNFAAAEAVHEMLVQRRRGVIRVFPATPAAWADAAFENLRTAGACLVSAARRDGATRTVRIVAERGGPVRLRHPFGDRPVQWNRTDVRRDGEDWVCTLAAGETLEGCAQM